MRQAQQNNRRGRGRGRKAQNPLTKNYESNGPDVKIRGTAAHISEKYNSLARDALAASDIVRGENYLQHAEHYNRIIMAAQQQNNSDNEADDADEAQNDAEANGQAQNAKDGNGANNNKKSDARKNNRRRRQNDGKGNGDAVAASDGKQKPDKVHSIEAAAQSLDAPKPMEASADDAAA